ncbi:MAG: FKBP-type peptidyl-prolyl cis-trans isomerase [Candidatus Saccharibacteria bacterium]|nr:FKBP-type peptidyl-prolyl cis-trans isomerase [Patescibacteria group bacterium]MCA9335574.1 FKBP-type peptidyl-prolyl cis-trans isomerase [Candidatus Saccharibacteria bacterium]MCA9339452.1 FKBP-type peptidyl-prolyl cis-trans isomerase [Candidatus Saccharibacteria bacterium]
MATTKVQRYGILAILIVTVIGTIGSFAVLVLGTQNQAKEAADQQKVVSDYQEKYKEYTAKVTAQGDELSKQYYGTFSPYSSQVAAFDLDGVRELATEDLVVGDGEEITGTTKFAAYYIGWNPKGKVFDQSIDTASNKLKAPLSVATGLDAASLIAGWKEGMKGMRINGVRVITIPSDKAYGEQGQGDDIPPNTPLKFVVMAIPAPAEISQPEIPSSLMYQGM